MKDELFFYLRIYFFIFWNKIVNFKKFLIFYLENDKVSEIWQFRKFYNSDKLSNTLSVKIILKK